MHRALLIAAVCSLLLTLASRPVIAEPVAYSVAPVDRLLQNTQAYIEEHPEDADGPYMLGRLHLLAASMASGIVPAYPLREGEAGERLPTLMEDLGMHMGSAEVIRDAARNTEAAERASAVADLQKDHKAWRAAYEAANRELVEEDWQPKDLELQQEAVDTHARAALVELSRAIAMDAGAARYHLTLASLLEFYANRAGEVGLPPDAEAAAATQPTRREDEPEAVVAQWRLRALAEYAAAFRLSHDADATTGHMPMEGLRSLVSFEAGHRYRSLAGELPDDVADAALMQRMQRQEERLSELPPGPVSPIVFSLTPNRALPDLLGTGSRVMFDLDGDGRAESRPWVKPDTGILVWDPHGTGRITSGRQLFGNVTWWMFWRDGYAALEALDDDRDGELAGEELLGLAVWFDWDGNAVSDAGEVVPVGDLGIVGLAARVGRVEEGTPMNPQGLRLEGGAVLPTWDWIAE